MNENSFFRLAIRELDFPDRARGVYDIAEVALMGAIAQCSRTRDEFIANGFAFLDGFKNFAEDTKQRLLDESSDDQQRNNQVKDINSIIDEWVNDLQEISLAKYFSLLAADWDERHGDE